MRKIAFILIMLIAAAFTASAEAVRCQVKYVNEYHNVQTAEYTVWTDDIVEDVRWGHLLSDNFDGSKIIDKDSDAKDLAIVNKLDKQGHIVARAADYETGYVKVEGKWYKVLCWNCNKEVDKESAEAYFYLLGTLIGKM